MGSIWADFRLKEFLESMHLKCYPWAHDPELERWRKEQKEGDYFAPLQHGSRKSVVAIVSKREAVL